MKGGVECEATKRPVRSRQASEELKAYLLIVVMQSSLCAYLFVLPGTEIGSYLTKLLDEFRARNVLRHAICYD